MPILLSILGPNTIPAAGTLQSAATNPEPASIMAPIESPSSSSSIRQRTGIGPGGLLLATLPLVLAPMLSYLFTPMIIPVTATIAAGRRKKRAINRADNLTSFETIFNSKKTLKEPNFIPFPPSSKHNSSKRTSKGQSSYPVNLKSQEKHLKEIKVANNLN